MLPLNEYQTSVVERGEFGCFGASHIILRNRQSRLDDLVSLEFARDLRICTPKKKRKHRQNKNKEKAYLNPTPARFRLLEYA